MTRIPHEELEIRRLRLDGEDTRRGIAVSEPPGREPCVGSTIDDYFGGETKKRGVVLAKDEYLLEGRLVGGPGPDDNRSPEGRKPELHDALPRKA